MSVAARPAELDSVAKYRVIVCRMRSSQIAAAAGVNVQTLRYYERRGLLPQPVRLESGYRAWGLEAVRAVRFVKRAQRLGFTLDEIETLLELAGGGPASCDAARRLACEKVAELDEKLGALNVMRGALVRLAESCARPREQRDCPLLHAFAEGIEPDG
jgi:DNA-binding transcriptional MerR regulator